MRILSRASRTGLVALCALLVSAGAAGAVRQCMDDDGRFVECPAEPETLPRPSSTTEAPGAAAGATEPPVETPLPGGGFGVDVGDDLGSYTEATRAPDGTFSFGCGGERHDGERR